MSKKDKLERAEALEWAGVYDTLHKKNRILKKKRGKVKTRTGWFSPKGKFVDVDFIENPLNRTVNKPSTKDTPHGDIHCDLPPIPAPEKIKRKGEK